MPFFVYILRMTMASGATSALLAAIIAGSVVNISAEEHQSRLHDSFDLKTIRNDLVRSEDSFRRSAAATDLVAWYPCLTPKGQKEVESLLLDLIGQPIQKREPWTDSSTPRGLACLAAGRLHLKLAIPGLVKLIRETPDEIILQNELTAGGDWPIGPSDYACVEGVIAAGVALRVMGPEACPAIEEIGQKSQNPKIQKYVRDALHWIGEDDKFDHEILTALEAPVQKGETFLSAQLSSPRERAAEQAGSRKLQAAIPALIKLLKPAPGQPEVAEEMKDSPWGPGPPYVGGLPLGAAARALPEMGRLAWPPVLHLRQTTGDPGLKEVAQYILDRIRGEQERKEEWSVVDVQEKILDSSSSSRQEKITAALKLVEMHYTSAAAISCLVDNLGFRAERMGSQRRPSSIEQAYPCAAGLISVGNSCLKLVVTRSQHPQNAEQTVLFNHVLEKLEASPPIAGGEKREIDKLLRAEKKPDQKQRLRELLEMVQ